MIIGAHVMLQSKDRDADIAFFRDILKLPNVDAGEGYMLFGVPSSEVAVHAEGDGDDSKLYLMCDDVGAFIKEMEARGIPVSAAQDRGWGSLTEVTLPGGGALSVYQPHHPRPKTGGGKGGAGKGNKGNKRGGKKGAKGAKNRKGGAAANLSPERQAKREERKKARAAAGGNAAAGGGRSAEEKKARQEQRKAKRAKKKASKGASSGGAAGEKS